MIEKVVNLDRKSFKQYTGPAEKFKIKNVVFGYNGRGKSSLALGLKDTYLDDGLNDEASLRFFNQDYVNDSLLLRDPITGEQKKIKGVIAHFSAKDVKGENKIKKLQEELVDIKPLENKLEELARDTRKIIDSIHDRRKGTANIQKRDKNMPLEEVVRLYRKDLDDAKKIEADEFKLSKIEGDNLLGEKIELIKTVGFELFEKITAQEIADAKEIFEESFENIDIPSSEVVDWLNTGLALHVESDDCKFCGGQIALNDLMAKVEEYNKNEKQRATKTLQALDNKVAELQNTIQRDLDKEASTLVALDKDDEVAVAFERMKTARKKIVDARNILRAKIKNIDNAKLEFVDFADSMQHFSDAVKLLTGTKNNQLEKLETQNNNKSILVKGAIGFEISNDNNIQTKLEHIQEKKIEIKKASQSNKALNGRIQELKQAESATADFASYINEILKSLNVHLKLFVSDDGRNYVIEHTKTSDKLTLADISEGERNLLALLFFYYELFDDSEQNNFKDAIRLVIIDDPISSVDDINKMYIIVLMKQILTIPLPQVFIMTHSWDDFSNLCYGLKDCNDTQNAFLEIKKDASGNSLIAKTKSNILPYHHNFIEVYEFSKRTDTIGLDDCDVYHMPNIIRQVLEGFLKFKIRNSSPTKSNEQNIARVLFDEEWARISEGEKAKLGQLLLTINVNSHSSSRSPDEIIQSAQFLMDRIRRVDSRHYNCNKEPA